MIEEKAKQFAKRPPSQYQQAKFYFRGGDVLREQEYLHDEYKAALSDYRVAEATLKMVESQVQDARDVLNEREGYTNALASFLESDTELSTKSFQLKQRLQELEAEIEDMNRQLAAVRATQNPAALAGLNKEKAYYMIEIQRGERMIQSFNEQRDNAKRQIAACTIHSKYRNALELEFMSEKVTKKKSFMRQTVAQSKIDFDALRPVIPPTDPESKLERETLMANIKGKILLKRAQEREKRRDIKHVARIDNYINQIEELNDRMCEIGLDEDVVETDELRKRCVNEDYSEDENEEDENDEITDGKEKRDDDENNNNNKSTSENFKTSDDEAKPSNGDPQSGESFERYEENDA